MWASTVTISDEARKTLEQKGKASRRLSANNRLLISAIAFWCMVKAIISLAADFACTCMANTQFMHSLMLWKILGYTAVFLALCIVLTIFIYRKLRQ